MQDLIDYAKSFLGVPYEYGGNTPLGIDCSGLACEIAKAAGVIKSSADLSAQDLYHLVAEDSVNVPAAGSFAFFGSGGKISHVGFMINPYQMIEAGGGDRNVKTDADAEKRNAFVRMRPVSYRNDLVATLKPRYNKIGLI